MHTALLHDQTINEILGYKDIWKCTPEIADRDTIPDGEKKHGEHTLFGLGSSVLLLESPVTCNAISKRSSRLGNTCLGMKGCMAPRGSSICLSYSLTHNPGYPQWSLHHIDLV
jgi:hypothetical protein